MKNLKFLLITIICSLSLSSFSQTFDVQKELVLKDGEYKTYESSTHDLPVTRVDSKFNGRGKVRLILFNDNENTKMVLKCEVVKSYVKEGNSSDHFTFILRHDILGLIEYDANPIGEERTLSLEYDDIAETYTKLLVMR